MERVQRRILGEFPCRRVIDVLCRIARVVDRDAACLPERARTLHLAPQRGVFVLIGTPIEPADRAGNAALPELGADIRERRGDDRIDAVIVVAICETDT